MTELPKSYNAQESESRWYKEWEDAGVFQADAAKVLNDGKKPYVVMMPPPNVTGTLHNGHALFVTLQDMLVRAHRMKGFETLWLPGVDHAGIATQSVVERELKRHEGLSRYDLGREDFLKRIWEWKDKNGSRIVEQMKCLGASADWSRERFTMDEQCSKAVRSAFVKMWNDGLIYRGERLVNWDPATQTALSNEEVEHEERDGSLWKFAYRVHDSKEEIVVATTRPETMLGDSAVAVHPEDDRYKHLVGKSLVHPFFDDRNLCVIADDYVDQEFGTGAVKITPAHDPNDFEMGQRHNLEMINIFALDASVSLPSEFFGMDRYEARKAIKHALEEKGLTRGETKIRHAVSISQRSNTVIEPMLSRQYFVKAKPLAEKAIQAIESGETRLIPSNWKATWDNFMLNIRDWCISRQLWWGHRIPVYYDLPKLKLRIESQKSKYPESFNALNEEGRDWLQVALFEMSDEDIFSCSIASEVDLEAEDPRRYRQEKDVLDTWFSSGLWPFSTLGWPNQSDDLSAFYPGAVLETGFDILFFWVARMMMMGTYFMGESPFKDIYLHAMVRDADGKKMSKSLGNAIDPLDVINGISKRDLLEKTKTYPVPEAKLDRVLKNIAKQYPDGIAASGADGLRFSLAALSGQGRDVKLALARVEGYRSFLNKIWNATRFTLMKLEEYDVNIDSDDSLSSSFADTWILHRLNEATERCHKALDTYRFDQYAESIYHFFWDDFCDWYVEFAKVLLNDSATQKASANTLVKVLDHSMRLLHPLCPFISETIWQSLPARTLRWPTHDFCALATFPSSDPDLSRPDADDDMSLVTEVIRAIRNTRQESGLSASKQVPVVLLNMNPSQQALLKTNLPLVEALAKTTSLVFGDDTYTIPKLSAAATLRNISVVIPLEGLIDVEKEIARLEKSIAKINKESQGLRGRLSSPSFTEKAPAKVVESARAELEEYDTQLANLKSRLADFR